MATWSRDLNNHCYHLSSAIIINTDLLRWWNLLLSACTERMLKIANELTWQKKKPYIMMMMWSSEEINTKLLCNILNTAITLKVWVTFLTLWLTHVLLTGSTLRLRVVIVFLLHWQLFGLDTHIQLNTVLKQYGTWLSKLAYLFIIIKCLSITKMCKSVNTRLSNSAHEEYCINYNTICTWKVIPLKLQRSTLCPFMLIACTNEGSWWGGPSPDAPLSYLFSIFPSSFSFLEWSIGQRAFGGLEGGPQSR